MKTIIVNQDINICDQLKDSEEIVFKFDQSLSIDKILDYLKLINEDEEQYYIEKKEIKPYRILLKGCDTEDLIKIYKYCFNRLSLVDPVMILNLNLMINGYNTLDDSLFESEDVYVSDLEQLLDIKLELSKEIKSFQTDLTKWFLASLKSMHKVEYTYLDQTNDLPLLVERILSTSNLLTMSQIFAKSDPINTAELPLIKDAYPAVIEMASCSAIANKLMQGIQQI